MLKKFETTTLFEINKSILLLKFLIALHLLSILPVLFTPLALVYKIALIVVIMGSLRIYLIKENSREKIFIRHKSVMGWELAGREEKFDLIEVLPSTVVTPYFSILNFKIHENKKQTILIIKDGLTADNYRKLVVLLKMVGLKNKGDNESK